MYNSRREIQISHRETDFVALLVIFVSRLGNPVSRIGFSVRLTGGSGQPSHFPALCGRAGRVARWVVRRLYARSAPQSGTSIPAAVRFRVYACVGSSAPSGLDKALVAQGVSADGHEAD